MTVEREIADVVRRRGISRRRLAEQAGIPYQILQRSLLGRRELRAGEFLAVCAALEADPKTFMGEGPGKGVDV